jgi:hypothetical protein
MSKLQNNAPEPLQGTFRLHIGAAALKRHTKGMLRGETGLTWCELK